MGLLSSILGKVLGDQLADAIKKQINDATGKATGTPASSPANPAPSAPSRSSQAFTAPVRENSDAEWRAYFREILQAECYSYTIREDVPVTEVAGYASDEFKIYKTRPRQMYRAEWGQPYTFVLYQGLTPKGVVMLGSGHSHDSNVKYLVARMYAKKLNIPYINFYTQMPNERDYVVSRLHRFLG